MYYKRHIFFCTNQRSDDRDCCQNFDAAGLRGYMKARVKELKLAGEGLARVNTAGCLDRCELGPAMVVYPEAVWYTYVDKDDIDEIIESHLINNKPVKRLML